MARGYPDYSGGNVNLYLLPEWAIAEGNGKAFWASGTNKVRGGSAYVDHTVTEDKVLYVTSWSIYSLATLDADGDKNQIVNGYITEIIGSTYYGSIGGNGGANTIFVPALRFTYGQTVRFIVFNQANHNCAITLAARGYEI